MAEVCVEGAGTGQGYRQHKDGAAVASVRAQAKEPRIAVNRAKQHPMDQDYTSSSLVDTKSCNRHSVDYFTRNWIPAG